MASPGPIVMPSNWLATRGFLPWSSSIPMTMIPPSELANAETAGDRWSLTNVSLSPFLARDLPDLNSSVLDSGSPTSDHRYRSVHWLGFHGNIALPALRMLSRRSGRRCTVLEQGGRSESNMNLKLYDGRQKPPK